MTNSSEAGELIGGLFGLAVLAVIGWLIVMFLFPDDWKIKYAIFYLTPFTQVDVVGRPTLCDFWRAPIGRKGCHFEKVVTTIRWQNSKDGAPIASYDDGKTWSVGIPDAGVKPPTTFVNVTWDMKSHSGKSGTGEQVYVDLDADKTKAIAERMYLGVTKPGEDA